MNSPGLQAGDQKVQPSLPATRRPKGGEWRGKTGTIVSLPRLKSRGYECTIAELITKNLKNFTKPLAIFQKFYYIIIKLKLIMKIIK
jgi:hypothetical protein